MGYKNDQYTRVERLIEKREAFYNDPGNGYFRGKQYPFILNARTKNFYAPIKYEVMEYFADNNITWWGGLRPTNHPLSSQIACVNHLFAIRRDKDAVIAVVKNIVPNVRDVSLILSDDTNAGYIQFEAVSNVDNLFELDGAKPTRGSLCTSIDALIIAELTDSSRLMIVIEWKYTESYGNENKAAGEKGITRKERYTGLINASAQLISDTHDVYYFEPFYQLMRQTLWAEQMIRGKETEIIKADDYLHVHIIPPDNNELLKKIYRCSCKTMEETWRSCIKDNGKYLILSPQDFLAPVSHSKYEDLIRYLDLRYWNDNE